MKLNDRIFCIGIVLILVMNKAVEMISSIDMSINPIETTAKILVMAFLTYELIKNYLLPKREKAR